jgi:hypothetical protein
LAFEGAAAASGLAVRKTRRRPKRPDGGRIAQSRDRRGAPDRPLVTVLPALDTSPDLPKGVDPSLRGVNAM